MDKERGHLFLSGRDQVACKSTLWIQYYSLMTCCMVGSWSALRRSSPHPPVDTPRLTTLNCTGYPSVILVWKKTLWANSWKKSLFT